MTLDTFSFRGHDVAFLDVGPPDGEPLVFLHNGGLSHRLFDRQIEHFRRSRRVIAMDWLGFGASDKPDIAYDADLYLAQVDALAAHLGLERFDLVGCCVGGAIAVLYGAAHRSRVRTLTAITVATPAVTRAGLLGPLLSRAGSAKHRLLSAAGHTALSRAAVWPIIRRVQCGRQALAEPAFASHTADCYGTPGVGRAFAAYDYDSHAALDGVSPPLPPFLLVWGEENLILPARAGRSFAERWRPSAECFVPGCGYMVMREAPDVVNAAIEDHLRVPPGAQPSGGPFSSTMFPSGSST